MRPRWLAAVFAVSFAAVAAAALGVGVLAVFDTADGPPPGETESWWTPVGWVGFAGLMAWSSYAIWRFEP